MHMFITEAVFRKFSPRFFLSGIVKDVATGEGLKGIFVSVDELNYNVTTSDKGEYWRLLMPGNYTLVAKGYG